MSKLDLTRLSALKGAGGEIAALKGPGFSWARGVLTPSRFVTGINLAGAEFTSGTFWPTNAHVDYYIGKGFKFVRLPFKWARMQPTLNGALDATNLTQMKRIVTRATAAGQWIALDMHNYMRRGDDGNASDIIGVTGSGVTAAHFADGWAKIATEFRLNPRVIFNLMNEPHSISDAINVSNQNAAAAAIRATGAKNMILFSSNHYSGAHHFMYSDEQQRAVLQFVDPGKNWALDLHQYLDQDYNGADPAPDVALPGAGGAGTLGTVTAFMRANGIRAFLGEFNAAPGVLNDVELHNHISYMASNRDVWLGAAWWLGGQGMDTAYYNNDPFILDPLSSTAPIDKPQMHVLQKFVPQPAGALPFQPFAIRVTPGDGQAAVTYIAGAGAATTQYRINGAGSWLTLGASPATITGLANGVRATLQFRSVNAAGQSGFRSATVTPEAPPVWSPIEGAAMDIDFVAQKTFGMAAPSDAISKAGGLGGTTGGLVLNNADPALPLNIQALTALRRLMEGPQGFIRFEADGMDGVYGGYLISHLVRVNGLSNGRMSFRTVETTTWQGVNVVSPVGGAGSRQVVVYAWDVNAPAGHRAYIAVSGGDAVTGSANEPRMVDLGFLGSRLGTQAQAAEDALPTAAYPNPRLLRIAVGTTQPSRAKAKQISALDYVPPLLPIDPS